MKWIKMHMRKELNGMFTEGQLVIYGGEGVCRIAAVGPSSLSGTDKTKLYYTLTPLTRSGTVLTPVDTKAVSYTHLIQNSRSRLGELCKKRRDSIFSLGKKISTSSRPNRRTKANTTTLPRKAPSIHSTVPCTAPKAYPPLISSGSPGMTATSTCKNTKIGRAHV